VNLTLYRSTTLKEKLFRVNSAVYMLMVLCQIGVVLSFLPASFFFIFDIVLTLWKLKYKVDLSSLS